MRSSSLLLVALIALLCAAAPAAAQLEAQLSELNAQALEAYQALDLETARGKLEEALGIAQQAGYAGPEVAQTFMNLGVVFVAGMSDRDQGLSAFVSAVCFQPDVQLDPLLSTPDVQEVFAQAQQDAQRGRLRWPAPGPGGPPQLMPTPSTAPPTVMGGGPQVSTQECPPGVVCDGDRDRATGPKDFARFFFNVQLAGGFSLRQLGHGGRHEAAPSQILSARLRLRVRCHGQAVLGPDGVTPKLIEVPINDVNRDGIPDPIAGVDRNMDMKPDFAT